MGSLPEEVAKKEKDLPASISYAITTKENSGIPQSIFEIFQKYYENQTKRMDPSKKLNSSSNLDAKGISNTQSSSAACIMKMATMRFSQTSSSDEDKSNNFFPSNSAESFSSLYTKTIVQNSNDVELAFRLLNAAQKISYKQFETAEKLLRSCMLSSLFAETPIQRVVKCFAEALTERIDRERNKIDLQRKIALDLVEVMLKFQPAIYAIEQKLPITQITYFAGMQAIIDSVGSARKLHFIDFGMKSGSHCVILMQGLANLQRHVKFDLIKITAVGNSRRWLAETGKRLFSFAKSVHLPFSYKIVVSEIQDLKEESFELEDDEMVAVYFGTCLWTLLAWPNHLTNVMNFVKKLKPCVMIVIEMDANTDTEIFMDRFLEAVTIFCAMFDCLDVCLCEDHMTHRMIVEEVFFKKKIENIVAAENEERTQRYAKIDFWRKCFAEFGIVEQKLSERSVSQADLMIKTCSCWSACSLDINGECMIVKWNETPINSLSVWKFE